jgi:CheY-like chemotaxis protein
MLGVMLDYYDRPMRQTTRQERAAMGPVLVVEDDPDVRDGLIGIVEEMGFKVIGAENGAEALALGRRVKPCLILLDLMLPVMNGWDFRLAQEQDPELGDVPVIVVTAAGDAEREARALGAAAGLSKPFAIDELQEVVARCS